MISAQSGPIMCTPITVSVLASTRIFMKPRALLPEIVFFIGLHAQPGAACPEQDGPHLLLNCRVLHVHKRWAYAAEHQPKGMARAKLLDNQHITHGLQRAESHFLRNLS